MFEKSLYDLIRGLRNHKGNEREYIQDSIRECRKEIRSQDMNLKAIALLKLTYLEMFGHDMSWASFNVLEVMSSQNYVQKKVGYLAAIQSFRPDTEVLMLAENLLKKDLTSQVPVVISLPLIAIPHVINPSMANSLLSDLLPRLTHSQAMIRKKTIVTLYRLALVYPETLRPAWPKIKERLQDENEDPSVTSAIVNVVCELGWRRPQDFLPLAPRLFDLLVDSKNNWMGIKIIKLFATLTPLEPRLIKKLLPPLTTIIKTTPAMSLLYECIHGIVQGGILNSVEGTTEGDELARLCVGKLRSMLVVEGDPNLKYVALLAFQKIVTSHPYLVALHQDAILQCIDDADISIRLRALELAVGMVNAENLTLIVNRLLAQLLASPFASASDDAMNDRGAHTGVEPRADSDDEDAGESLRNAEDRTDQPIALPEDYRINAIRSILSICSRDTYANVQDFDWYIEVLVKLVKACPSVPTPSGSGKDISESSSSAHLDVSYSIGEEIQNVAVRVKSMRLEASLGAQLLLMIDTRADYFPSSGNGGLGVLGPCAWIAGEYAEFLTNPEGVLDSLIHSSNSNLPSRTLSVFVHAALKVFAAICSRMGFSWTPQSRTGLSLLMARLIYFLEPLASHPALEVQERAVEYLELMRLASEAANQATSDDDNAKSAPLLLSQAIPNLFVGMELNPVAPGALRKVPDFEDLDLNTPINSRLSAILRESEEDVMPLPSSDEFESFYTQHMDLTTAPKSAAERLDSVATFETDSYQASASEQLDIAEQAYRRKERHERNRDDPFYIGGEGPTVQTRLQNIIKNTNGDDLDIDSIPIMDLDMGTSSGTRTPVEYEVQQRKDRLQKLSTRKRVEIVADENIDAAESGGSISDSTRPVPSRGKKSVLVVDSSGLGSLSLDDSSAAHGKLDIEQRAEEERALKEVERLRLEMQRASERIQAKEESVVVRKKKKKKVPTVLPEVQDEPEAVGVKKKKKAGTALPEDPSMAQEQEGDAAVAKKKKKKKDVIDGPMLVAPEESAAGQADTDAVVARKKKKKKARMALPMDDD